MVSLSSLLPTLLHSGIDQNLLNSHDTSSSESLTSMKKLVGFDPSHTVVTEIKKRNSFIDSLIYIKDEDQNTITQSSHIQFILDIIKPQFIPSTPGFWRIVVRDKDTSFLSPITNMILNTSSYWLVYSNLECTQNLFEMNLTYSQKDSLTYFLPQYNKKNKTFMYLIRRSLGSFRTIKLKHINILNIKSCKLLNNFGTEYEEISSTTLQLFNQQFNTIADEIIVPFSTVVSNYFYPVSFDKLSDFFMEIECYDNTELYKIEVVIEYKNSVLLETFFTKDRRTRPFDLFIYKLASTQTIFLQNGTAREYKINCPHKYLKYLLFNTISVIDKIKFKPNLLNTDWIDCKIIENNNQNERGIIHIPPVFSNKNKFTTTIHEPVIISITTKEQNSINNTILSISFIVEDGYRWHASSFTLLTEYEY